MTVYLASGSPRRATMLSQWSVPFEPLDINVTEIQTDDPKQCALANAMAKAQAGGLRINEGLVVGADTVVACDGRAFGKPCNEANAREMLDYLENRGHRVITAIAGVVMPSGVSASRVSVATVWMRALSEPERAAYFKNPEYRDKAGAYAVQGLAASFIERIEGPMDTVIGFTMKDFYALCEELHVDLRR